MVDSLKKAKMATIDLAPGWTVSKDYQYQFKQKIAAGVILPPSETSVPTVYKEPLTKVEDGFGYQGVVSQNEAGTHVQCHICGHFFSSLPRHVVSGHKLSITDYRDKYELGPALLTSETERKKRQSYWFSLPEEKQLERKELLKRYAQDFIASGNRKGISKRTSYPLEYRNRRGLCPDQSLDRIIQLAEKLGHTPSEREYVKEYRTVGISSIKYFFGRYTTAVKTTGLRPKGNGQTVSNEQLLDSILLFREAYGREPLYGDFKNGKLAASSTTYSQHFGGIGEARRLATQRSLTK